MTPSAASAAIAGTADDVLRYWSGVYEKGASRAVVSEWRGQLVPAAGERPGGDHPHHAAGGKSLTFDGRLGR